MGKTVVFVTGSSGNIGAATVNALAARYADKLEIRAGARNPDKLKVPAGVTAVQATMGDKKTLKNTFKGVNALYIVTPGLAENRAELTIATAEAAKEAGVKHLVVLSASLAPLKDNIFGAQLAKVEDFVKKLGVPYTFLRLPYFLDNFWGFKDTIVGQGTIYSPVDPQKPFTAVAVEDAGLAAAVVLADPAKHAGKTYNILSDRQTYSEVAQAFSKSLGKEIKYVRVPYDAAKQSFLGAGYPEWQVNGLIELCQLIDNGAPETNVADLSDYEALTGEKRTTYTEWIAKYAPGFQ